MNRRIALLGSVLLVTISLLTACGGTPATPTPAPTSALSEDYEDALSTRNQLLLGTLRLQGTAQQLTAAQAQALLPLWQAFKTLTSSETTAAEETTAVLNQIQSTLTAAQVQAVVDLKLTNADLTAWYAEQGITMPTPQPGVTPVQGGKNSDLSQEQREATRVAAGTAGTPVASGGTSGTSRGTLLVDAVITALQQLGAQ